MDYWVFKGTGRTSTCGHGRQCSLQPTPEMTPVAHVLRPKVKESSFLGCVAGSCLEEARETLVRWLSQGKLAKFHFKSETE